MKKILFLTLLTFAFTQSWGQYTLPAGFYVEKVYSGDLPMGTVFDAKGNMYVHERNGRVFKVNTTTLEKKLILDITEEVATFGDYGTSGMALDPNFAQNGYFYLCYSVDPYYLFNFGKPNYRSDSSSVGASITRISRFTLDINNNFESVVPNSKKIIIGQTPSTGFPITGELHPGGHMEFSSDGSLIVSVGEGSMGTNYEAQALAQGIVTQEEDQVDPNKTWRVQLKSSYSGKMVRIDPQTGNGVVGNPYFDPKNPDKVSSKVWAMGLRNPYRFTIRPLSGSDSQTNGKPGSMYIFDVGQDRKEEINVSKKGGENFGYPYFEGIDSILYYKANFDTSGLVKPTIEWGRKELARYTYHGVVYQVTTGPFKTENFVGGCSMGGVFYTGKKYPAKYYNTLFSADFNNQWIRCTTFDLYDNPVSSELFTPSIPGLIEFTQNNVDGCIYGCSVVGAVYRINYNLTANQPPVADFTQSVNYGKTPLNVSFDATKTYDPEKDAMTYAWDFGDGTTATGINPSHTFTTPNTDIKNYNITLSVKDIYGNVNTKTSFVSVNNTPPVITSTSLDSVYNFLPNYNETFNLNAQYYDKEDSTSKLGVNWKAYLYHADHNHYDLDVNTKNTSFTVEMIPCDNILYYYKFVFTVTDTYGLSTVYEKNLTRACSFNIKPFTEVSPLSAKANWSKFANILNYTVDVASDSSFQNILPNYNKAVVNDTSLTISGLQPLTKYYFRLKASYQNFVSDYSKTVAFTTPNYTFSTNLTYADNVNYTGLPVNYSQEFKNTSPYNFNGYVAIQIKDTLNVSKGYLMDPEMVTINGGSSYVAKKTFTNKTLPAGNYTLVSQYANNSSGPFYPINNDKLSLAIVLGNLEETNKNLVYPNPSTNVLNIKCQDCFKLQIFDMIGKLVQTHDITNSKSVNTHLKTGKYLIKLNSADGKIYTQKVIINE